MNRPRPRRARLTVTALEAREVPAVMGPLPPEDHAFVTDRVIVQLKSGAAPRSPLARRTEELGFGLYAVHLRQGVTVQRALKHFNAQRGVAMVEPDYIVTADVIPNDPNFGSLYGMHNTGQTGGTADADIDAPEAWDLATGSGNVVVGVIDTGVQYNHPDLNANMWRNPGEVAGNLVDDDANGLVDDVFGADYVNNDGNPMDDNGHGTHVAGTIGAIGNNGIGVAGVSWRVQIMALKFLGAGGSGAISNAVKCLDYAVAKGAIITNNSWGGGGFSSAMSTALNNARAAGHLFIAAAGNSNSNNDALPHYPSSYTHDNVLAVAATDRNDARAGFSSYGATSVDLAAPGVGILSTYGTTYVSMSGTSMATPHVAGAAALVWDAHPTWTYAEVAAALLNTVDAKPNLAGIVATGGRLNVDAAVRYATTPPPDPSGPRVTASTFLGTGGINGVRLTFDEVVDAASLNLADAVLSTPTGQVSPTAVNADENEVVFTFPNHTTMGNYVLTVGPGITDLDGNRMDQDGDATSGEVPDDQFTATTTVAAPTTYYSVDVNKPITDFTRTVSILNIRSPITVRGVSVQLNLSHTFDGDLRMTLVAPDGTQVLLANRRGGSGDNFTNTVFHDAAQQTIAQGTAPFNSFYRPETPLADLNGKLANGRWDLRIDDQARQDSGWLHSWSLTFV